jgi:hypothetical protein
MSATDFKKQLAACQDQRAVERLLQSSWSYVQAMNAELVELREEVIRKVDELGS